MTIASAIRSTVDKQVSVIDAISFLSQISQHAAAKKISDLRKRRPDISNALVQAKFPNAGKKTPVASYDLMVTILLVLPGEHGKRARLQFARNLCQKFAIDPQTLPSLTTMTAEIENQADSKTDQEDHAQEVQELDLVPSLTTHEPFPKLLSSGYKRKYNQISKEDMKIKTQKLSALKLEDEMSQITENKLMRDKKIRLEEVTTRKQEIEVDEFFRTSENRIVEMEKQAQNRILKERFLLLADVIDLELKSALKESILEEIRCLHRKIERQSSLKMPMEEGF